MQVNRFALLIALTAIVFLPSLAHWAFDVRAGWLRPFLLWGALVAGLYVSQRQRGVDEL